MPPGPYLLGLTGSVGMGKSTTAALFAAEGIPVWDADAAVHRLYEGEAAAAVEAAFPGTTREGRVDRDLLAARVVGDEQAIARLESIVHPLVCAARRAFLDAAGQSGAAVAVLDIPLLFETGGDEHVDRIAVVSAPPHVQEARVMERPGMTKEKFDAIHGRQVPDAEKRARADFVIDTSKGFDAARENVRAILRALSARG
jgi:dephospho-CoA kinase